MTRFCVVNSGSLGEYEDDDVDDTENELTYSSDEDEPDHPLGFENLGQSRYALNPDPASSMLHYRRKYGYTIPFEEHGFDDGFSPMQQQYPPLSSYVNPETVSTQSLIRYALCDPKPPQEVDSEMDRITQMLREAVIVDDRHDIDTKLVLPAKAHVSQQAQRLQIRKEIEIERRHMEADHQEAVEGLKMLLRRDEEKAKRILSQEKLRAEELQKEAEEVQRREEERIAAEREAEQRQREEDEAERAAKEKARALVEQKRAKEREHVTKAQKLVAQLVQVRASVASFEKSKAVSKRRLKMKKIVNGKVNTLAENAEKIRSVAAEVSGAIAEARSEDEGIKQQIEAGNTEGLTPEMARGKRYLFDLLSSNVIVRVQAEGFNGQRGDGFPLASMLAQVSEDNKDLLPVLAAHIYTVCPTAIPTLPTPAPDASEDELMESLGMLKQKDGTFETFERFLARTEGIISLIADIMASCPPTHVLMGGHEGAVKWLARFLALLPPAPQSPLPLVTAPVLDAFLTGAGHMLANKHPEQFKKYLGTVQQSILNRLDEGPVGKPSSIRLKKTIDGGFEGFKSNLPSKALPDLYNGASSGSGGGLSGGSSQRPAFGQAGTGAAAATSSSSQANQNPFGTNQTSPFGQASSQQPTFSDPFGQTSTGQESTTEKGSAEQRMSTTSSAGPFGTNVSTSGSGSFDAPSPFTNNNPAAPSPGGMFGSNPAAPPSFGAGTPGSLGAPAANPAFGGAPGPASSPFANPAPSPSPFGGNPAPGPSPFGSNNAPGPSPFGGNPAPGPSPFGGNAGPGPSPFGGNPAPGPSPFGGNPAPGPSPFGGNAGPGPSPFGGNAAPGPSPFGGNPAPGPSPFGGNPAPGASPFGGNPAPGPSPFGGNPGAGLSPFGGNPAPSPSPFGLNPAPSPSTFGGAASTGSPFGSNPFGSGAAPVSAPFGAAAPSPSPFGNSAPTGGQQGGGFGSSSKNQIPCKFFAQGNCRYGDKCRFSHEAQGQGWRG